MVVPGCYALPSLNHFVWLGEAGEVLKEYKVEKISHYYTPSEVVNPITSLSNENVDGTITITVSVV